MSEHQKEALDRVVKALDTVPEDCRAVAVDALAHDAQILCRGIALGAGVKEDTAG